jgi:hypothetical protein
MYDHVERWKTEDGKPKKENRIEDEESTAFDPSCYFLSTSSFYQPRDMPFPNQKQ